MDEATEVARSFTNGQDTDAAVVTVGITSGQHIAEAFAAIRKGRHSRGHRHGTDVRGGIPISAAELSLYQKDSRAACLGSAPPAWTSPAAGDVPHGHSQLDDFKEAPYYTKVKAMLEAQGDEDGIRRLEEKLADVQRAIEDIDYRAANIRAGFVYVISNIGSFGHNMVKIGLTRRLEPLDRIRELGDASVPFRFDVLWARQAAQQSCSVATTK